NRCRMTCRRGRPPLPVRRRAKVVGVWHEDDLLIVRVLQHLEGAGAALTAIVGQVVGPGLAPLGDNALLGYPRGRIDQRFQEEGYRAGRDYLDGIVIDGYQAIADKGLDGAAITRGGVFDVAHVVRRGAGLGLWIEGAVHAVDHVLSS